MSSPRKEYDLIFKYYLVGESEVGKTSLMRRFALDKFIPDFQRTKNLDYRAKSLYLQQKSIYLEFWDTVGLDKYRKRLNPPPLDRAEAVFVVYDITNAQSFSLAEQWIQDMKAISNELKILLIGNKTDLDVERVVSYERGYELATRYNIIFYETSAKTGMSIEDITMNTTNHILQSLESKKIIQKELIALNKTIRGRSARCVIS